MTRRYPALKACLLTLLLIASCYLVAVPYYRDGDQDGIRSVIEGLFSPLYGPHPYMVWVNVLLGYPLAALYRVAPGFYWYDSAMLLAMATGIAILFHALLRQRLLPYVQISALGIAAGFAAFGIIGTSFSQVAAMLCFGGVIAWLEQCRHPSRAGLWLGAGCVFVASLVRFEVYQFFLPIQLAASLPLVLALHPDRTAWKRLGLALLLTSLAVLAARYWHRHLAYDWVSEFWHYNGLRNMVMDYFNMDMLQHKKKMQQVFAAADWTRMQHRMMSSWWLYNTDLYSADSFTRLFQASKASGFDMWGGRLHIPLGYETRYFTIFFLFLPLLAHTARRTIYLFMLALLFMSVHMATVYLLKPMPVYINSALAFCLVGFGAYSAVIWERADQSYPPMVWPKLFIGIPFLFWLYLGSSEMKLMQRYARNADLSRQETAEFVTLPDVDVVVSWGLAYPYSQPFRALARKGNWQQINGASFSSLPMAQQALDYYGLAGDVEKHICERPGTVIEANLGLGGMMPQWRRFAEQQYGIALQMERLYHGQIHDIYRCRVVAP